MRDMITSRANPLIKETARLGEKKYRDETGLFIFEGRKLLEEAAASGVKAENVFMTAAALAEWGELAARLAPSGGITPVSDEVYAKISEEKSPQGVLCTAKHLDNLHKRVTIYKSEVPGTRFALSSVRDPGNLGTVIRSAAAFGADELLLSADCAELYSPKTLRASMGALFRQRVTVCEDLPQALRALDADGYSVYAAMPDAGAASLEKLGVDKKTCFVVGNEGHGLDSATVAACHGSVVIPMAAGSESLNAAAAAAVLLWELYRNS